MRLSQSDRDAAFAGFVQALPSDAVQLEPMGEVTFQQGSSAPLDAANLQDEWGDDTLALAAALVGDAAEGILLEERRSTQIVRELAPTDDAPLLVGRGTLPPQVEIPVDCDAVTLLGVQARSAVTAVTVWALQTSSHTQGTLTDALQTQTELDRSLPAARVGTFNFIDGKVQQDDQFDEAVNETRKFFKENPPIVSDLPETLYGFSGANPDAEPDLLEELASVLSKLELLRQPENVAQTVALKKLVTKPFAETDEVLIIAATETV
jgi:hypothetical protein